MTKTQKKNGRSGTQWTDSDYAHAGYERLSLRIPTEVKSRLKRLADMSGWSVAELVAQMSAAEEKRREKKALKIDTVRGSAK